MLLHIHNDVFELFCKTKPINFKEEILANSKIKNSFIVISQNVYTEIQLKYPDTIVLSNNLEIKTKEVFIPKEYLFTNSLEDITNNLELWAKKGIDVTTPEIFLNRIETCTECDLWDKDALNGTGKCNECGCSTQAKLRLKSESCPLNKWTSVE